MRVLLAPGQMRPEPAGVPLSTPGRGLAAPRVAGALARGWLAARPGDDVVELPMADGSPGSAQCLPARRVRGREALQGRGPTGQIREVDLVQLDPAPGAVHGATGRIWFLDAARLLSLPADAARAAQEAREGTTRGLGEVIAQALGRTCPGDSLIVGLSRSAVNDGGAGLIEALGRTAAGAGAGGPAVPGAHLAAARTLLAGRSVGLALADGLSLGGVSGAGAGLGRLAGIGAQEAQDLDRAAGWQSTFHRLCAHRAGAAHALPGKRPDVQGLPSRHMRGAASDSATHSSCSFTHQSVAQNTFARPPDQFHRRPRECDRVRQ